MTPQATLRRRLLRAVALLGAPTFAVLLALALGGWLSWAAAAAAAALVASGMTLLMLPHFKHIEALRSYVNALRSTAGNGAEAPQTPASASPILAPSLDAAIVETAQERERRRRELETAMADSATILSNLPDPLLMLDRNRRIARANRAAEELFGAGTVGRNLTDVLRNPTVLQAADAAIAGQPEGEIEFSLHGDIERQFGARLVALSTPTMDGTVATLTLHDLSDLRRAERMRVDFVANASHELRTPLSSMIGFIETLRGPAREDTEAQERFLAIMHEQSLRMSRLVEDLLSLSRIEMREHTPPSGQSDLREILDSVLGGVELKARARAMRIETEFADCAPVIGEKDELTQVFQNLVDNAMKYGRGGTAVRISVREGRPEEDAGARRVGRPCVAVVIADQGEGIPREHLPRLTERFYRVDTARSRELGGTGLGLAIVKHIVNRHRGLLTISSTVGEGSSFTVYLPTARVEQQQTHARPRQQRAV